MTDFFKLLFAEGSVTCYTESPFGYKAKTAPGPSDIFFCINELYPDRDNNPTKDWHDPAQPRRADANVCTFRNFLIEIDDMPTDEQIDYVLTKIPVSAITYSGGSSYHFIISLETPLPNYNTYMAYARRLLKLLPKADRMCKNPSRLSRIPDVVRPDTGRVQKLEMLIARIPNEVLDKLLPPDEAPKVIQRSPDEIREYVTPLLIDASIRPDEVMEERGIASRNAFFYWLGCRMAELKDMSAEKKFKTVERAYNNLRNIEDFPFDEALMAARIQ